MPSAEGHHRPLNVRRRPTVATTFPGIVALRHYERGWLRGDVLAGVTVAAYLIPQVMAYAQIAGLPPAAGLLAIVAPTLVYAVLGSSRQLSVGPESTTALMTATAVAAVGVGGPDEYVALAAALAVVTGGLCVLGWAFGVGFLADLFSKPVLVGYLTGVAVLMVVSQVDSLTGIDVDGESMPAQVWSAVTRLDEVHVPTLVLSGVLLVLLLLATRFFPRLPNPLFAALLGAAAVAALGLDRLGVATVGPLPDAVPELSLPDLSAGAVAAMIGPALGIAVVAYSDNVLTARAFAERSGERIDANQEFLALGVANVAGGLLSGFPVSSSGSRTAIGAAMGSRTQLYSLATLVTVLLSIVALAPVIAAFPQAALGALVVYAAIRLVDVPEIRRVARFRRSELVLLVAATLGVFALGALYGILLAVALSLGDLLRRVARPHDGILGYVSGMAGMHDVDDFPDAEQVPGLVVYRYDSPLFFANAEDFHHRALTAVEEAEHPVEWLLINTEANVEVDLTSLDALARLHREMEARGIVLALARVKQDLMDDLRAADLVDAIGADRIYPTLPTAVAAYLAWHEERAGRPHPFGPVPPPLAPPEPPPSGAAT
ncbi:SulP family inorganic anion transporter [Fodinibacter luteus]|uniref:SulP family inorganic anion transporter n=1 Tax=Fodinibacter luteus TaxID=552064 RepID=UPI0031EA23E2